MVLTYDAYSETLESEKHKDDKLTSMEKQFNLMQSQFQMLISTLGNTNNEFQFIIEHISISILFNIIED
jgi:hypothetical protein